MPSIEVPGPESLVVRPAEESDLAALAALRFRWRSQERWERGLGAEAFESAFREWASGRDSHVAFLAARGPTPVGMAWLVTVDRIPGPEVFRRRSGNVQSVYVIPEERGRGVGTKLVERCIAEARARELEYVTLHHTERSESLYRRLGFDDPTRHLELRLRPPHRAP